MAPKQSFPVFLSSLCRRAPRLEDLRAIAFHDIGQRKLVYVDEQVKRRNVSIQDDLEAADELIAHIRQASQFVCVLAGSSHGTPIDVAGLESRSSFFEIELYQATLTRKTIHLLVRDDFSPEPRLAELLKTLGAVFPSWFTHKRLTDKEILAAIQRIVDQQFLRQVLLLTSKVVSPANRLVQALYSYRAKPVARPPLLFLDGAEDRSGGTPRTTLLDSVLNEIKAESDEERRLSRIWIGMRELMVLNHRDDRSTDFLSYKVASLQSNYFGIFLTYKIERPVLGGDKTDIEIALNSVSAQALPLQDFVVILEEAKHGYLVNEKLGKLRQAGLEAADRAQIEAIIQAKISGSYIYNLKYLAQHNVMTFNIMLELGRSNGLPARITAALEYKPEQKVLRVVTLH